MIDRYVSMLKLMRLLEAGHGVEQLLNLSDSENDAADRLMRMAMLFHIFGDLTKAWSLQHEALQLRQHYQMAADREPATLRLLVIMKAGFLVDNTPLDFLLEGSDIACELLYVTPDAALPAALPPHDLVFIAIGHFQRNQPLFDRILPLLETATGPVLNRPSPMFGFDRDRLNTLLQDIPGAVVPRTDCVTRTELERMAERAAVSFPVIVRPLLSHGGKDLERLTCASDLAAYLARQPEPSFYVAPYIDYRSDDGLYRKCRLLLLRGRPLVCHYAISSHWMVHYQSAGMTESAAKRDEEARFFAEAEQVFCHRHRKALAHIAQRIGLDYVVIDCGETPDGKLLFFEADNVSLIHATDPIELFPYKQVQMNKVMQAFRAALRDAR